MTAPTSTAAPEPRTDGRAGGEPIIAAEGVVKVYDTGAVQVRALGASI
jgi:hypothetical protein